MFKVCHFQKPYVSHVIEEMLHNGKQPESDEATCDSGKENSAYTNGEVGDRVSEKTVKHNHQKRHDQGRVETCLKQDCPLLTSACKVGCQHIAEKNVEEDGKPVVQNEGHGRTEDGGENEDRFREQDHPHDHPECEHRNHVEKILRVLRSILLQQNHGYFYEEGGKGGKKQAEEKVLVGKGEFPDVLLGEMVDDGD